MLVIDDHISNVSLLTGVLRAAGIEAITTLTDSRLAADAFTATRPDLVLLDLHMPFLDGIEVMAELHRLIEHDDFVPIIVLTADATPSSRRQALEAGAKDFLTKPFDNTEVTLRVKNLLESRLLYLGLRSQNADLAEEVRIREAHDNERTQARFDQIERVQYALQPGAMTTVFQPIVDLENEHVVGVEALTRFSLEPARTPDVWFREAAEVGLGNELELAAIATAVRHVHALPASASMSINLSPEVVLDERLAFALRGAPSDRIVIEITEHSQIADYAAVIEAIDRMRGKGFKFAVDDTGAGFAGLQQIIHLRPEIIKLDLQLTRGIDTDPIRRVVAVALGRVAHELRAEIVAEGIETASELEVLRQLGFALGQGYLLGRPQPIESIDWGSTTQRRSVAV